MLKTPFFELESRYNAFFTEFAGCLLPLHFGSAIEEALLVRNDCGFFDISHMGRIKIKGEDAEKLIKKIFSRNELKERKGHYGFLVSQEGKVIDDIVVFKNNPSDFFIVVNAARKEKDIELLKYEIETNKLKAEIKDISSETAFVAIQGPKAKDRIKELSEIKNLPPAESIIQLKRFSFIEKGETFISRTGYTGEDGFELSLPAELAEKIWKILVRIAKPCGLAARDILRLEAGLILYGLDLDENTSPFGSHLEKFISEKSERFELMKKNFLANPQFLKGVILDGFPIPQSGDETEPEGKITSAVFSAVLKKPIAFARFKENLKEGERINVKVRGKKIVQGTITKVPFIQKD